MAQDKEELDDGAESPMAPRADRADHQAPPRMVGRNSRLTCARKGPRESRVDVDRLHQRRRPLQRGADAPRRSLGARGSRPRLGDPRNGRLRSRTASTRSANSSRAPPRCSSVTSARTAAGTSRLTSATRRGATSTSATTICPAQSRWYATARENNLDRAADLGVREGAGHRHRRRAHPDGPLGPATGPRLRGEPRRRSRLGRSAVRRRRLAAAAHSSRQRARHAHPRALL